MLDGGLSLHGLTGGSEKNGRSRRENSQLGKADLRGDGNDGGHRIQRNSLPQPEETMTCGTKMGVGGSGIRKGKLLIISKPIGVKQTEP